MQQQLEALPSCIDSLDKCHGYITREYSAASMCTTWRTLHCVALLRRYLTLLLVSARVHRKRRLWAFVCCYTQVESFFAVLQPIIAAACTDTLACSSCSASQQADAQLNPAEHADSTQQQQQQQQQRRLHIVDFGCSTGNLLLPLAALFPCCSFTGVDMKPAALQLLQQRAAAAGLLNVAVFEGMIEQYSQPFDVALGLHACGNATDHVLQIAVHCGAAFVVSPCCVGESQTWCLVLHQA
jgi:SAM-dependent methyltransferase